MRRPKGSGSILRTREGKFRALFAFRVGAREDIDGSPFATRDEAERALDAVLAALHDAGAVRGGITLRKLGEKALDQREAEGYRAIGGDRAVWELRIATWDLASMPASTITAGDVREWLAAMRNAKTRKPLAKQTRANALNLLRAVFAYGVEHELVTANPCTGLRVKDHGTTRETSTYLSRAEADALIAAATDPGVALAIGTGMRAGELRSLEWPDVHEDRIVVRYGAPGKPPKNGRIREIPVLPVAANALAKLRAMTGGEGLVLPAKLGGHRSIGAVFDRADWKTWLKAAKLTRRVRPHDLRHTCATLLLTGAWGRAWTYEEVKEMLGHSSVKVTERYARATGTLAQRAAAEMAPIRSGKDRDRVVDFATQAREIIQRRGCDSNARITVLQTELRPQEFRGGERVAILCRSYLAAVAEGSPFAHARGLDLAEAVLDAETLSRPASRRPA